MAAQSLVQPSPSSTSPRSRSNLRHLPPISSSSYSLLKIHSGNRNGRVSLHHLNSDNGSSRRSPASLRLHQQRFSPASAFEPHHSKSFQQDDQEAYKEWNMLTGVLAAAANIPFLLLQLPQILLNARNLFYGNKSALFAISWMSMLTGMLGNLSLLAYFSKKRETGAVIVQCLGVIFTYVVLAQLAMAEAMPFSYFVLTSVVAAAGLFFNFLHYFGMLPSAIWNLWDDFTFVGGFSVLIQVIWCTFVPYLPRSMLPGAIALGAAIFTVIMSRAGKLSEKGIRFLEAMSGWIATLLFMWMSVAQMWTNYLNPGNIKGLSSFSVFLSMLGNGLMIPRALFTRDIMWFTGSAWASFLYGWGNLLCLYLFNNFNRELFFASTVSLLFWIGFTFWKDSRAHGHSSPLRSLKELGSGL